MYDREYDYVSAIARAGSLSGAALELGVSQPALTYFLKKEEEKLGTPLFQRVSNCMVLTYAGECYMENVEKIVAIQKKMLEAIADIAKLDRGRIRFGIPAIRRPFTISSVIPEFKKRYPNIDLFLVELPSDALEEKLENMELDCIAVNITRKRDCFDYTELGRECYVYATRKNSELCKKAQLREGFRFPVIKPEQLEDEKFIMLERQHRIRQFADRILEGAKIKPAISMYSRSLDGALEAVVNGLGGTFTPLTMPEHIKHGENIRFLSLDAEDTEYDFSLVCRKGAYLPPSTRDFMNIFKSAYEAKIKELVTYEND